MIEILEYFNLVVLIFMSVMLAIQSFILYRLLPEIKKVSGNSEWLSKVFTSKKDKKD